MHIDSYLLLAGLGGAAALFSLLLIVRKIEKRNRTLPDDPQLWSGRNYRCPQCGASMEQGWVLMGKGAIWSPRSRGKPGTFSSIGSALPNTISLSMRPGANMGWHCAACQILILDHDKLVR